MPKTIFTFLFLFSFTAVFTQNSDSRSNRASLESCSLTEAPHRIDCFKTKLHRILFDEVLKNAESLKLSNNSIVKTDLDIILDESGVLNVEISTSENSKLDFLITSTFASFEKMFPVKDKKARPQALKFSSTFIINIDPNGKIALGEKKDQTEGLDNDEPIPFDLIEKVPVYPGCKGNSNQELKKCLSISIKNHIIENFNFSLVNKLDLPRGLTKLYVNFTIDKNGDLINILPKADHRRLEKEAIRIMKKVPRLEPGQQKGKAVSILYSVPIVLQVE